MIDVDFDTVIDRRNTDSLKWEKYRGTGILPLWVADMDFASPPAVIAALQERAAHGVFGYTVPSRELTETIISRFARLYRWSIAPEWIVWLPGLVTGLNVVCRGIGAPGDHVMTATPVYPPFLSGPGNNDKTLITVPLRNEENRWFMAISDFEKAVTERTRLYILCNPHNPVGRMFERSELTALLDFCCAHDLVICSDEIHCDLILDERKQHIPFASLGPEAADRCISLFAPSKTYNIPGLGCAFAVISNTGLRRRFKTAMQRIVPEINCFGYVGALAAYRHGDAWLAALLEALRENHRHVQKAVAGMPGVTMTPVEATYLAWLDMRPTGIKELVKFFEAAGVGLSDGTEFGLPGFVRLNFGCPSSTLHAALTRMQQALAKEVTR
ncbi:MAG: PatB family C-S lyase [Pseudomonadota bacterium]